MDNAQKAIMIGVGLFITIIIIAAVMVIVNMGQGLVNDGTKEISKLSSEMQRSMTLEYDNKIKTGVEVLAAIKKYYKDPDRVIILVNDGSKTQIQVGGLKATKGDNVNELSSDITPNNEDVPPLEQFTNVKAKAYYIVPTARYQTNVLLQNGAAVGIVFVKQ